MSNLADAMHLRTWKYVARYPNGKGSGPYLINENLTGAVVGDQMPARINFRSALLIVAGFNDCMRSWEAKKEYKPHFRLVIPNT